MKNNTNFFISSSVLLRMRNISDKSCRDKRNTLFVRSDFFSESPTVYETMWKNIVERDRSQMTIWRMRVACWMPNAKNTHSEYAILIDFPLQNRLQERAPVLRYTDFFKSKLLTASLNNQISKKKATVIRQPISRLVCEFTMRDLTPGESILFFLS